MGILTESRSKPRPVGNISAWTNSTAITINAVTQYYTLGGQTVAMRQAGEIYYLAGAHLGSTSLITNTNGAIVSETRYTPYGEERWSEGTLPTDHTFTGQRAEDFGLLDYNARYYDPALGRFIRQRDSKSGRCINRSSKQPTSANFANIREISGCLF